MGPVKEALLRSGVYVSGSYTIEEGAGNYQVIRDGSGRVVARMHEAMLSSKIIIEPCQNKNMIDLYSTSDDKLTYTTRYLKKFAQQRGYLKLFKAYNLDGPSYLLITRPDGKTLRLYSSIPPTTSKFAADTADNKWLSYQLLQDLSAVKQPDTILIQEDSDTIDDFLNKHSPVVVKPVDSAHGNGISINITTREQADEAIYRAGKYCRTPGIILQKQLPIGLPELRIVCINYQYTVAMARVPATVTGDGISTLEQLIDSENTNLRTAPYKSKLAYIDKELALKFLGERATTEIPSKGEKVRVLSICNVGKGGTMEDMTDQISLEQRQLSEQIARHLELPVIGIDFYGDYLIEVNAAPALYQPVDTPNSTLCVERFLDYLETLQLLLFYHFYAKIIRVK